ncbi:uncharacterized protein LOC112096879 [Citrus clementina]|uniref:uncharacterized protein LOC112096879 n=1 Tax=Citrus clementina TaxID=85681 RepID=UPI000CECEF5F|nr:uncharacterized protein LOC112096879 [Citrus x clementina]
MDTEELIRKCKAITIREEDKSKMSLGVNMKEQRGQVLAGCLMGKVLLSRGVNREGLKVALQQVWRTFKEVKIDSLGNNIFMFKFAKEADKKRVLSGGPWHFDRALIVLTEPKGIGEVSKQAFTDVPFWVQIRNIPMACMERDFLQELEGMIGKVEEIETDENGDCFGEFARIRIFINITQPLKKILFLKQEGETDIPMPLVYERLPDFCFCCGIIGHQFKECAQYQGQPKEDLSFGMWMNALMIGGRSRKYRGKERWQNEGERTEKSTSSEFHDQSQQLQQEQVKPADKNGLGSGEEEMGQTKGINRTSEVEWVGEQHLMKSVTEMMATKQADGEMQGGSTGNVTIPRDLRINVGTVNSTEGEKMEVVRAEKRKETLGSNAAQEEAEETKIYPKAGSSQT